MYYKPIPYENNHVFQFFILPINMLICIYIIFFLRGKRFIYLLFSLATITLDNHS